MSKFKKIMLTALIACMSLCIGIALAACNKNPDFKGDDDEFNGKYEISVQSLGGMNLDNVKVDVKKDGVTKGEYFSVNGKITFTLTPDEYDLVVDESSLPAGYFLTSGATFKTSATEAGAKITLSSRVINSQAPAGTSYRKGDVMYDFTFIDIDGVGHSLATTLSSKKAVVLNFWGPSCVPCRAEFPAMQAAYESYKDKLEIFALASYNGPTEAQVKKFKEDYPEYSFPMGMDNVTGTFIYNYFGVTKYPTTVIIDRYGVVSEISEGGETSEARWKSDFNKYTSDNYSQEAIKPGEEGDDTFEWAVPNVTMPSSSELEAAANGNGANGKITYSGDNDDENSWPWIVKEFEGKKVLSAANTSTDQSYATLYCDITLNAGDGVSYEYYINTAAENNIFFVFINGNLYDYNSGNSEGWLKENLYVANRTTTIRVGFLFTKYNKVEIDTPCYIRNLTIYDASKNGESVDLAYSVTENAKFANGKYDVNVSEQNGIYYYTYNDNTGTLRTSILYADILEVTHWSEKHYGASTFPFESEGAVSNYKTSLYWFSFWYMSNIGEKDENGESLRTKFKYDPDDTIIINYYLQGFSTNGYTPVTPKVVESINAFIDMAHDKGIVKGDRYDDEWLEFCYYFMHWGKAHEKCSENTNPVQGLTFDFAYEAVEYDENKPAQTTNRANIDVILNLNIVGHMEEAGGGAKFTFVPKKTGVYLFKSSYTAANTDPRIIIYNSAKREIAEQDDNLSYNHFLLDYNNFFMYVELQAGQTYYVNAALHTAGDTGSYDFTIEYQGSYVEHLRVCTTGDGQWTWREDADGNPFYYYIAIPVVLNPDDRTYYEKKGYDYGSVIYIDFVNPNYYETTGKSLYDIAKLGAFNFTKSGGQDYTDKVLEYYAKSIEGKDKDDELYGMIEANEELVFILNTMIAKNPLFGDSPDAYGWLMFANYYATFGTPEA